MSSMFRQHGVQSRKALAMLSLTLFFSLVILAQKTSFENVTDQNDRKKAEFFRHKNLVREFDMKQDMQDGKRNIFFLEVNDNLTHFPGRLLCALESAAKCNRKFQIYLILSDKTNITDAPNYFSNFPNVHFVKASFDALLNGTKLERLWQSGGVTRNQYPMNNLSDLLRIVIAFRFGGMYMDTDVLCLRAAPELENLVITESEEIVSNAVFALRKGHRFLVKALEKIANDFRGDSWGFQGPTLFTTLTKELCNSSSHSEEDPIYSSQCDDFSVLPPDVAYSIRYWQWMDFYDQNMTASIRERTVDSFATHYWNYMRVQSASSDIEMREDQPLYALFVEHCPQTEEHVLRKLLGENY